MLKKFLNEFKFNYVFKSSTEIYKKGLFNESLLLVLEKYEQIMEIIIPTLRKRKTKNLQSIFTYLSRYWKSFRSSKLLKLKKKKEKLFIKMVIKKLKLKL